MILIELSLNTYVIVNTLSTNSFGEIKDWYRNPSRWFHPLSTNLERKIWFCVENQHMLKTKFSYQNPILFEEFYTNLFITKIMCMMCANSKCHDKTESHNITKSYNINILIKEPHHQESLKLEKTKSYSINILIKEPHHQESLKLMFLIKDPHQCFCIQVVS